MPGGPIPLGVDGAYEGLCDSWDSFDPFLIRLDVGCRGLRGNIVRMFISGQGVDVTRLGESSTHPLSRGRGQDAAPQIPRGASE